AAVARRTPRKNYLVGFARLGVCSRLPKPTVHRFRVVSASRRRFERVSVLAHGLPSSITKEKEDMRRLHAFTPLITMTLVALVAVVLTACMSTTGKTAGEDVDDATITSEVKAKLAAEKMSTLTRIAVDTERRTVYLTGTVDTAAMR